MTRGRGRGRGSTGHIGKSAVRSNPVVTTNISTIPTPTTVSPEVGSIGGQDDTNQVRPLIHHSTPMVQTSGNSSNPTTPESSPTAPNQINATAEAMTRGRGRGRGSTGCVGKSALRSIAMITIKMPTIATATTVSPQEGGIGGQDETNQVQSLISCYTLVVQTSDHGSNPTTPESSPTAPNQSNPTTEVKKHWMTKAATVYRNFIAKIKEKGIRQDFIDEDVWESWQRLWVDSKCIEKSKTNVKNHRGSKEVAAGTQIGRSISI
ncbi:uncharacterized protein LOC107841257 [Capsicum annuum]|uniref:uncharacterized protein LOC107841257 n=1 Tax=Capsicum annuum TaxID=4072 RepID=UPI001FB06A89|nr:uncharacterized protein LOC107841257 [Capsicum annuum]